MKKVVLFLALALTLTFNFVFAQYFPPKEGEWEKISAKKAGFDEAKLNSLVNYAETNEYSGSRDLRVAILEGFSREPYHDVLGPTKKRGGPAGIILKGGRILAQWGDTRRVDMTFSVTKSYLSTVAGLAVDKGLIASVNDPIINYVWDGTYEGEHNAKITWEHMLTQSSDWSGTLFGLPAWSDRPPRDGDVADWQRAPLHEPGSYFKYNDVRVNVLSYSLLQVWRRPLPEILKGHIMDPIGASTTWRWLGYDHAWVTMDGHKVQSVTGGGHSGGGVFISTEDHARFGLLFLNEGNWNGQQLLSRAWVQAVQKSSSANPSYGYMWWLNRGSRKWPGIDDESIYYAAGFGGNFIIIDKKNELVVITRWLEPSKLGDFMLKLYEAME